MDHAVHQSRDQVWPILYPTMLRAPRTARVGSDPTRTWHVQCGEVLASRGFWWRRVHRRPPVHTLLRCLTKTSSTRAGGGSLVTGTAMPVVIVGAGPTLIRPEDLLPTLSGPTFWTTPPRTGAPRSDEHHEDGTRDARTGSSTRLR